MNGHTHTHTNIYAYMPIFHGYEAPSSTLENDVTPPSNILTVLSKHHSNMPCMYVIEEKTKPPSLLPL